jgi:hypothetical protein
MYSNPSEKALPVTCMVGMAALRSPYSALEKVFLRLDATASRKFIFWE